MTPEEIVVAFHAATEARDASACWTGRHVASTMPLLAGLPPTGAEIAWDFIHLWRVADGQIVEHWAC